MGIVSDSQGYPYKEDWGFHNLERAFEVLAKKGIDVLVNAGDIVDGPEFAPEGLRYVQGLGRKWFGETKSWKYLGNFYRYERNRDSRLLFKAMPHAMKNATRYRAQVYPVANFGTEGEPLVMDITVRDRYGWRNDGVPVPYPQE